MDAYKELIELLLRRELGILGRQKTEKLLEGLDIKFDFDTKTLIHYTGDGKALLEVLGHRIQQIGGDIAFMGAKISLILKAWKLKLELPPIFAVSY